MSTDWLNIKMSYNQDIINQYQIKVGIQKKEPETCKRSPKLCCHGNILSPTSILIQNTISSFALLPKGQNMIQCACGKSKLSQRFEHFSLTANYSHVCEFFFIGLELRMLPWQLFILYVLTLDFFI